MSGPRTRLRALAVVCTLALTSCAEAPTSTAAPTPMASAAGPASTRPPAATAGSPLAAPAPQAAPSCDERASLRPAGLPAPGQMLAGSAMARIAARGRLIVGTDQDSYLFAYRNLTTGQLEGFEVDLAHAIAAAIFGDPNRIEMRPVAVADRIRVVQDGSVDMVVDTLTITCERRQQADFSAVYFEAGQRVLVGRDSTAAGLADLGGMRVCASRGSTSLHNVLTSAAKPVPVGAVNETDCLMLLQLGEVDAISTDDAILVGLAAQDPQTKIVGPRFTQEPYGVAVNQNAPELARFVNAVLERWIASGAWAASYARWLGPLGPPPAPPQPRYQD